MRVYTEFIAFNLTKELKSKLEKLVDINKRPLSHVIRTILEEYFEEDRK